MIIKPPPTKSYLSIYLPSGHQLEVALAKAIQLTTAHTDDVNLHGKLLALHRFHRVGSCWWMNSLHPPRGSIHLLASRHAMPSPPGRASASGCFPSDRITLIFYIATTIGLNQFTITESVKNGWTGRAQVHECKGAGIGLLFWRNYYLLWRSPLDSLRIIKGSPLILEPFFTYPPKRTFLPTSS